MDSTPSTANSRPPRHSAAEMLLKIGTPCSWAIARPMSFSGNWSMYIDAISTLGAHKPSSVGNPLRNLETITSACDRGRYSVMIAAIFFLLVIIGTSLETRRL